MDILVIDVGGGAVKILASGETVQRRIPSGPEMTAPQMVDAVIEHARGWHYDAVSLGYPGAVRHGRPALEPNNLGGGWVGFDFEKAFARPVKVINDAALQAVGGYDGGTMLFLGLGTGLGTAMVVDHVVAQMELSQLPYKDGMTYGDFLASRGLERLGLRQWRQEVATVVPLLRAALVADYVVLGGGNVRHLDELPPSARLGSNLNAFIGGFRLWEDPRIRI